MNAGKRRLRGSCHCGNISFEFFTTKTDAELPKRQCQCSFYRQHGRISTSNPDGEMRIAIAETDKVSKYRFGHRTADFYVCRNCCAVPVVSSEIDGTTIGLVDVRMIQNSSWSGADTASHDYEGEPVGARLARRKSNWMGTVNFD